MSFAFTRTGEESPLLAAALYVVATPIGNLADVTLRALQVIEGAELVLAEDTRVTRRLLDEFGLQARPQSCHEHNEAGRVGRVLSVIRGGGAVALVSDAGTPLISDPGYLLVRAVRDAGLPVHPVPGASALTAALSVSGLPCEEFLFAGFLPARAAARRVRLGELAGVRRPLVFYEAGRRLSGLLADIEAQLAPDREVVLLRELTKVHEEVVRGPARELRALAQAEELEVRGEFVVIVDRPRTPADATAGLEEARRIRDLLGEEMSASRAARMAARITGVSRKLLYDDALSGPGDDADAAG